MANSSPRRTSKKVSKSSLIESGENVQSKFVADPSNQVVDVSPIGGNGSGSKRQNSSKKPSNLSGTSSGGNSFGKGSTSRGPQSFDQPSRLEGIALGMIETRGMVPAIEASDAMTKAGEVNLICREYVGGGYVTVMVRGETGAVNASVRAGADACERVGDGLVAAHIIARPDSELEPVLTPTYQVRK